VITDKEWKQNSLLTKNIELVQSAFISKLFSFLACWRLKPNSKANWSALAQIFSLITFKVADKPKYHIVFSDIL